MPEKLHDDSDLILTRFQCACLDPAHVADIMIELTDDGHRALSIEFCTYANTLLPYTLRLKRAWKVLCGRSIWEHGFIVRQEDLQEMIETLKRAL